MINRYKISPVPLIVVTVSSRVSLTLKHPVRIVCVTRRITLRVLLCPDFIPRCIGIFKIPPFTPLQSCVICINDFYFVPILIIIHLSNRQLRCALIRIGNINPDNPPQSIHFKTGNTFPAPGHADNLRCPVACPIILISYVRTHRCLITILPEGFLGIYNLFQLVQNIVMIRCNPTRRVSAVRINRYYLIT